MPDEKQGPPTELPIDRLEAHPSNSNVMPKGLFDKLVERIGETGRYPPVIVRPMGDQYQVLDGHHRVAALRRLRHTSVQCVVWQVNDDQALLLLATLNRLSGDDHPLKRAALVSKLSKTMDTKQLADRLPEDAGRVRKLLALHAAPPPPQAPTPIEQMPVCLHFFLLPDERRAVEQVLKAHGGTREQALLDLLCVERGGGDD